MQHQTRAQLDMRRSFEPWMTRSLDNTSLPFAKHWISIENEHHMTPPSRCLNSRYCAVKPRVSCEFHSLLGSHRAQHSVRMAASPPSTWRTDPRLRLLHDPLVSSQLGCRVEREGAASARTQGFDGWRERVRRTWRRVKAGQSQSQHATPRGAEGPLRRKLKNKSMCCILCGKRSWLCAWTWRTRRI